MHVVTLTVNGESYVGWEGININRDIEQNLIIFNCPIDV